MVFLYVNTQSCQPNIGCFILEQIQIVVTSTSDIGNAKDVFARGSVKIKTI